MFVPIESITITGMNPRKDFDKQALKELANSIRIHGIIEPLIVRRGGKRDYELVAGERRHRAAQSITHDNKVVKKFTFSLSYKPDIKFGDEIRICTDKSDAEHMTTLHIRAKTKSTGTITDIVKYPLSLRVKDDYITVKTGEYKVLWSDIEDHRFNMKRCHLTQIVMNMKK
jgi:hypothetical protein